MAIKVKRVRDEEQLAVLISALDRATKPESDLVQHAWGAYRQSDFYDMGERLDSGDEDQRLLDDLGEKIKRKILSYQDNFSIFRYHGRLGVAIGGCKKLRHRFAAMALFWSMTREPPRDVHVPELEQLVDQAGLPQFQEHIDHERRLKTPSHSAEGHVMGSTGGPRISLVENSATRHWRQQQLQHENPIANAVANSHKPFKRSISMVQNSEIPPWKRHKPNVNPTAKVWRWQPG